MNTKAWYCNECGSTFSQPVQEMRRDPCSVLRCPYCNHWDIENTREERQVCEWHNEKTRREWTNENRMVR